MKTRFCAALAATALLAVPMVSAHDEDDHHDRGRYGHDRDEGRYAVEEGYYRYPQPRYVQAKVVRVEPIRGYDDDYGRYCGAYKQPQARSGINQGAVVGAVIGGIVGNQAGSEQNRVAATLAGAAIGGLIGQSVDRRHDGSYDRQYVQCHPDWNRYRERDIDYRVTYRYNKRYNTTVMPYYPGKTIQIRVDARPLPEARVAYRY